MRAGAYNSTHHKLNQRIILMAESVSITGPVKVASSSEASTALELMNHISSWESASDEERKKREYWFKLYYQCRQVTRGNVSLQAILDVK
jgi:hypothetical protein